ncbi:hypothetical protein [Ancylomarina sp. 16SWW S1-10-2]|uniref:hypothetical protein n=1 Tax=Ancylomarina sp. 16SWW S1-10-2 TaxID=2499681 RepID=UPI0012ADA1E7|nr:hypothetical protein [Ancylomarina sp. 16SWW S1-10-2]MRT92064.1 hypothetical protein [Ancylomarina sp. 16SWW S1-10-2]
MNSISGRWSFTEDFGFGKDEGFAELTQEGENIKGVLVYTERIEDETPFRVQQEFKGTFKENKLEIMGTAVEILDSEIEIEYHLDTWEGILNDKKQIVGHSYDKHECFGVFVMEFIQG